VVLVYDIAKISADCVVLLLNPFHIQYFAVLALPLFRSHDENFCNYVISIYTVVAAIFRCLPLDVIHHGAVYL